MNVAHPFHWISKDSRKWAFIVCFALTMAVMAGLQLSGGPLVTAVSPSGIVSFEFAGNLDTARAMIASWGADGRIYAGINLGLDYLFLVVYAGAIGLGCTLIAEKPPGNPRLWVVMGSLLAWAQIVAAALDATENYALIRVLLGSDKEIWPAVANLCAFPKFTLVALGLVYVLIGTICILFNKKKRKTTLKTVD